MLSKLTLKMKLTVGFGLLLANLVVSGFASYRTILDIQAAAVEVDHRTTEQELAISLTGYAAKESAAARGFVLTGDEKMSKAEAEGKRELNQALGKLTRLLRPEEGQQQYAEIQRTNEAYYATADREIQLRRQGKTKDALRMMSSQAATAFNARDTAITAFAEQIGKLKEGDDRTQDAYVTRAKTILLGMCVAGMTLGLVVSSVITRSITGATAHMVAMIQELAANNLSVDDLEVASHDELGKAALALNQMKNNLLATIQSIAGNAQHVASASEELSAASQQITANSEETSAQASVVSQATKQVSQNLQSVSTGAEEMTSTIQSIAGNAHDAATVASRAVETAQAANSTVAKLGESSAEIGEVIKVITSIAQQTNLLALNATIEAARAGEAGKGFAVVANEVKELAKQTAKATEDISQKITAIQQDTKGAVDAIGSISRVITQVNEISGTIATAVEQQSATTNEMTRNVADAAKGAGEITLNIEGVAQAAQGTSNSAQQSQKAATELAGMAEQLRGLVGQFKIGGPAANLSAKPRAMAARAGK
jgi:methyl-accepting chemotaxis protein